MTTRVTEGTRRERLPPSFLASRGFAAKRSRAPALTLTKSEEKERLLAVYFGCVPGLRLSAYTGTTPDTRAQIILTLTNTSHVSNVRYHQVDHLQVAKGLHWYKLLKG